MNEELHTLQARVEAQEMMIDQLLNRINHMSNTIDTLLQTGRQQQEINDNLMQTDRQMMDSIELVSKRIDTVSERVQMIEFRNRPLC